MAVLWHNRWQKREDNKKILYLYGYFLFFKHLINTHSLDQLTAPTKGHFICLMDPSINQT